jgi:acetate kinase
MPSTGGSGISDAIVVLNAGSSSLKFAVYRIRDEELALVARGKVEGLGTTPRFKARDRRGVVLADMDIGTTAARVGSSEAFRYLAGWIGEHFAGALSPAAVGHRVVHGGLEFAGPALLNEEVIEKLERLIPLAPRRQAHNLDMVKVVRDLRPDLPQVACFDTSFHRGRLPVTERFGLSDELHDAGVRRWGFHGLSYESVMGQFREIVPETAAGRVIVAHLGRGVSACGMRDGRSFDTTMGFSTLDGLPMGTRCGSLDAGVVLFLMRSRSYEEVEKALYEESGMLGLSGISGDVRELLESESPAAAEAVDFFVYRTVREIGSLTSAIKGLDALIFTGAIGESSPAIRQRICRELDWLGVALEPAANQVGRGCISPAGRSPSVWVIPTDEERVIAAGTLATVRADAADDRRTSTFARGAC